MAPRAWSPGEHRQSGAVKYYASSSGARHKSDRGDAFLIAHFCLHNDLMAWQPLDEVRQALRAISRQRAALVRW
ncbi:MAG: transposase [Ardenticatenales bacterium]|nr:transposase [Ardenticatenales bacterium]